MEPIQISEMTDLQLADSVIQIQSQSNFLQSQFAEVSAEIQRRKQMASVSASKVEAKK